MGLSDDVVARRRVDVPKVGHRADAPLDPLALTEQAPGQIRGRTFTARAPADAVGRCVRLAPWGMTHDLLGSIRYSSTSRRRAVWVMTTTASARRASSSRIAR